MAHGRRLPTLTLMDDDPLLKLISPLAGVVLAVVLSVMVSATVAGSIGGDY